jgi:hypothetical protein
VTEVTLARRSARESVATFAAIAVIALAAAVVWGSDEPADDLLPAATGAAVAMLLLQLTANPVRRGIRVGVDRVSAADIVVRPPIVGRLRGGVGIATFCATYLVLVRDPAFLSLGAALGTCMALAELATVRAWERRRGTDLLIAHPRRLRLWGPPAYLTVDGSASACAAEPDR